MTRDWETWLRNAAAGPSDAEKQKRDRTEQRIRDAIAASLEIGNADLRVFAKGSYANNTNVRLDADVDIAVEWTRWFYTEKFFDATDLSDADLNLDDIPRPASPSPTQFRAQVERALIAAFGVGDVDTSGNKAITVKASSTTLDSDVVPCFRLQRYDSATACHRGIRLWPKTGTWINNWPQQNLDNGRAKNTETGRRYKKMVRCLKRLENDMLERAVIAKDVDSFLLECLLYNVPNDQFPLTPSFRIRLQTVVAWLWHGLRTDGERANESDTWVEVNELKYLFSMHQRWTREQAFEFVDRAWGEIGPD